MKPTPFVLAALLAPALAVRAEPGERDPLRPPEQARPAAAPASGASGPTAPATSEWRPRYLIASGGKRWLVQDARRYGIGDALGSARIERIDDDAVWLRESGKLSRVPLFGSVAKQPAGTTPTIQTAARKERQP